MKCLEKESLYLMNKHGHYLLLGGCSIEAAAKGNGKAAKYKSKWGSGKAHIDIAYLKHLKWFHAKKDVILDFNKMENFMSEQRMLSKHNFNRWLEWCFFLWWH